MDASRPSIRRTLTTLALIALTLVMFAVAAGRNPYIAILATRRG